MHVIWTVSLRNSPLSLSVTYPLVNECLCVFVYTNTIDYVHYIIRWEWHIYVLSILRSFKLRWISICLVLGSIILILFCAFTTSTFVLFSALDFRVLHCLCDRTATVDINLQWFPPCNYPNITSRIRIFDLFICRRKTILERIHTPHEPRELLIMLSYQPQGRTARHRFTTCLPVRHATHNWYK